MKQTGFKIKAVAKPQENVEKFIEGASTDATEKVEAEPEEMKLPWEGVDRKATGKQTVIRLSKVVEMKIDFVQQNTLGGISFAKLLRDSLEVHLDQKIADILEKN